MNDIREIVTKAVIGKGKKKFTIASSLNILESLPDSILGCWLINHKFEAKKSGDTVEVRGSYDVNVWYSYEGNTKTEVARKTINYGEYVNIHRLVRDYLSESNEVMARTLQQPTCTDAKIEDGAIVVEVEFEMLVEVIGETKMRVAILGPVEYDADLEIDDEIDAIEQHINTNFLSDSLFSE